MKVIAYGALIFTIFIGCSAKQEGKSKMISTEEGTVTRCVGGLLIDVPRSLAPSTVATGIFKVKGRSAQDPSVEVAVRNIETDNSNFSSEVAMRRAELMNSASDTVDVLRMEKKLSDESTLFRIQEIDDAYVSEIRFLRGKNIVTASLGSYRNSYLAAEEALINFAQATKEVREGEAPVRPNGFCLGNVIVMLDFKEERGSFHFRDALGTALSVDVDTYIVDGDVPLLKRMSGPDSLLTKFDVRHTVLRSGERTLGGMRAQEWLGWTKLGQNADEKTFAFALETLRPAPGKATPHIHLELDTAQALEDGTQTKTTMLDEEAIQLWDLIVKSIRPVTL
jgi:hypothetical protein